MARAATTSDVFNAIAEPQRRAQSAPAEREIVISRVIDAPRERVFEAFTELRHLSRWRGGRTVSSPRAPSSSASAGRRSGP